MSTTKSLDPIIVTALRVDSQGKVMDPPHVDLPAIVRSQRHGQRRRQGLLTVSRHQSQSLSLEPQFTSANWHHLSEWSTFIEESSRHVVCCEQLAYQLVKELA